MRPPDASLTRLAQSSKTFWLTEPACHKDCIFHLWVCWAEAMARSRGDGGGRDDAAGRDLPELASVDHGSLLCVSTAPDGTELEMTGTAAVKASRECRRRPFAAPAGRVPDGPSAASSGQPGDSHDTGVGKPFEFRVACQHHAAMILRRDHREGIGVRDREAGLDVRRCQDRGP